MEHCDCAAVARLDRMRADAGRVQFPEHDSHDGDRDRAAVGRTVTGRADARCCAAANRPAVTDMRTRSADGTAVRAREAAGRTRHRQGMAEHAHRRGLQAVR